MEGKSAKRVQHLEHSKNLHKNIEATSHSIKLYRAELANIVTPTNASRLGEIFVELSSMLSSLSTAYEQVRQTTPSVDRSIVRDIDALTEEIKALQGFVCEKQDKSPQKPSKQ